MAVEIGGYCYNDSGQVCITVKHSSESATSTSLAQVTITLTVNGKPSTHEMEVNGTATFCQSETTGKIVASDSDGDSEPVEIEPMDPSNKC